MPNYRQLLNSDLADDGRHARTLELLRASEAMKKADADLRRHADEARRVLVPLPLGPAKLALEGVCDLVVARNS